MEALGIEIDKPPDEIAKLIATKSKQEIEQAIFQTWTGHIAQELGFKKIYSSVVNPHFIRVYFEKTEEVEVIKTPA